MKIPERYVSLDTHRTLVDDLLSLNSAEERLEYLMERRPIHPALDTHERTEAQKVPGCLSGLWLKGDIVDGVCQFAAHSDSDMVGGVASYLCDLYSTRSPEEVMEIGSLFSNALRLDSLLSTTRKRALSATLSFIMHVASQNPLATHISSEVEPPRAA